MTVLSGQTIERRRIIHPCLKRDSDVFEGVGSLSWGLGPAGYDLLLDLGDPQLAVWLLAPGEFMLAATVEHFTMPDDVLGVVHDKSTWARRGLALQNTVIEPGWRGFLTLELTNHGNGPIFLPRGVPIAQVVFHLLDEPASHPYDGKYQDQAAGPQAAR